MNTIQVCACILLLQTFLISATEISIINTPFDGLLNLSEDNIKFNLSDSNYCEHDLYNIKVAIIRRELWALKMLDASGRPSSGFLFGNNFWLGSQLQCLDINIPARGKMYEVYTTHNLSKPLYGRSPLETHFLVATFTHNAELQEITGLPNENLVTLGLCLPRSCQPNHIHTLLGRLFNHNARPLVLQRTMNVDLTLLNVRSVEDDSKWLAEPKFIIVISLLCLASVLTLLGTLYDVYVWRPHLKAKSKLHYHETSNGNNNNSHNNNADKKEGAMEQFQLLVDENNQGLTEKKIKVVLAAEDEKWLSYKQGSWGKFLLCFSVPTNTKVLMNPKLGEDSMSCLHGMRFMGMAWIIMVHTVFYLADFCDNRVQAFRMAEGFAVQVVANSTLAVDTFFFLSGFLIAYLFYKGVKKSSKSTVEKSEAPSLRGFISSTQKFSLLILRRFVRLTPVYMMMVGIFDINQTKYNKTSLFTTTERADVTCGKYWWRNMLYINNMYSREEMCMSWSWYISNDMQFFIIGTFLLLLSLSYRKVSALILTALLIATCVITAWISYSVSYVPTLNQQFNMLNLLYDPPWTRIGPYLVGMVTGWFVVELNGNLPLKKWQVTLCWLIGSSLNVSVLFGLTEREISPTLAAAYVGLSRSVWGIGLAWIVVACSTRHAGIIGTILEFPGWVPLSRLTYCAYLLNPMLMQSVYLGSESAQHVDFLPLSTYFFGHLGMCYFCSYVLTLLFESPNILLMRWLINDRTKKQ